MPISGNATYVPTMSEFIAHWEAVDAFLGVGNELVLGDGTTLAVFSQWRGDLRAARDAVEGALNGTQIQSAIIAQEKAKLLTFFGQFASFVRANYAGSPYLRALPDAPSRGDAESKFLQPMVDAANLWRRLNATLSNDIALAAGEQDDFAGEIQSLREAYEQQAYEAQTLTIRRGERDIIQQKAYAAMKSYRLLVSAKIAAVNPLVEALPRLTPKAGVKATAVVATVSYDEAANEAVVTFTENEDATLQEYQLRGTAGDQYEHDDESVVATLAKGGERVFRTAFALGQPGAQAAFKVYVVLESGNERGSNTVVATRPLVE